MAEHRGCWRLYGEGLESGEDGALLWIECGGFGSLLTIGRYGETHA